MEEDSDQPLSEGRFNVFKEKLVTVLNRADDAGETGVSFSDVFMQINQDMGSDDFSAIETEEALVKMSTQNQIFYSDGMIYRI